MEKQYTKAIKDYLVKYVAADTNLPESVVDGVVMWAYKDARDATATNSSVELSGFGSLLVSPTKLKKRWKKFDNIQNNISMNLGKCTEGMRSYWEKKQASCAIMQELIKRKLQQNGIEIEPDSRRISQPSIPQGEHEGSDRSDVEGTTPEMPELPVQ